MLDLICFSVNIKWGYKSILFIGGYYFLCNKSVFLRGKNAALFVY